MCVCVGVGGGYPPKPIAAYGVMLLDCIAPRWPPDWRSWYTGGSNSSLERLGMGLTLGQGGGRYSKSLETGGVKPARMRISFGHKTGCLSSRKHLWRIPSKEQLQIYDLNIHLHLHHHYDDDHHHDDHDHHHDDDDDDDHHHHRHRHRHRHPHPHPHPHHHHHHLHQHQHHQQDDILVLQETGVISGYSNWNEGNGWFTIKSWCSPLSDKTEWMGFGKADMA